MTNLANTIKTVKIDSDTIANWNSVAHMLKQKHIYNTVSVEPAIGNKFKSDLYGLFLSELNIPEEHIYPHILVNGYESPDQYDGSKLSFNIIASDKLEECIVVFNNKK